METIIAHQQKRGTGRMLGWEQQNRQPKAPSDNVLGQLSMVARASLQGSPGERERDIVYMTELAINDYFDDDARLLFGCQGATYRGL